MTLISAIDDFVLKTLAALPGLLKKLQYVLSIRDSDGVYQHWGMSRVHGEQQAQRAMAQAHSDLFLQVLRRPLAELFSEFVAGGETLQMGEMRGSQAVPADLAGGSALHFSSVLDAVSALAQTRGRASHEAA